MKKLVSLLEAILLMVMAFPLTALAGQEGTQIISPVFCIPFAGLLLCVAIMPLVKAEWWESHQPHAVVFWSVLFVIPFAIFFGGNLWDGIASLFVGALIRVTLYAFAKVHMKAIFSNILCSLISGMACILMCRVGPGQHVEMIMIGNIMLLIPGVLMTNSFRDFISGAMISGLLHFSEAMITAVCVAVGFIFSKILLGGIL